MKSLTWLVLLLGAPLSQHGFGQTSPPQGVVADPLSLYVKVRIHESPRLSSLKPGDVAEGDLTRDVYSGSRKLFATGSHIRLTVDHLERRRRIANDHWPWVAKIFMPRHEKYPVFKNAIVSTPEGAESPLQVSLISVSRRIELQAQKKKGQHAKNDAVMSATAATDVAANPVRDNPAGERTQSALGPIITLEARAGNDTSTADAMEPALLPSNGAVTLPPGTACRVLLLAGLSASKSHAGDVVEARLLEPLLQDSRLVMPAGTLFEGKVMRAVPPRWGSRAGSLSLTFSGVTLPDGSRFAVATSLTGIELNRGSHTRMDSEGGLRGDRPGAVWMLINGGMTAGIAKEVDDGTQLLVEAILSGATDVSTAGTARIAGAVVSGIFMVTRHGRDVVLPNLTEMNITLNRPLTLSGSQPASSCGDGHSCPPAAEGESGMAMIPALASHE